MSAWLARVLSAACGRASGVRWRLPAWFFGFHLRAQYIASWWERSPRIERQPGPWPSLPGLPQDMKRRNSYGHIINMVGLSGHRIPDGPQGGGFYCATKAAVKTITEGLRQEVSASRAGLGTGARLTSSTSALWDPSGRKPGLAVGNCVTLS